MFIFFMLSFVFSCYCVEEIDQGIQIQSTVEMSILKEELFCTPKIISAKISPCGNILAYVGADKEKIPNVFIKPKNDLCSESIQLTFFKTPQIIQFFWSADSTKILLLKDEDGTGRLNLYGIDIDSKKVSTYAEKLPHKNAKIFQMNTSENKAAIGLKGRNPHFYDVYLLDLDKGNFNLLLKNDSYANFLFNEDLQLILKMKIHDDGSWTIFKSNDELLMQLNSEDAFQTEFISYDAKRNAIYFLDNRFSNTNQLMIKRLGSMQEEVLGSQLDSDVDEVIFIDGEPKAYATYYTQKKWHLLDEMLKEDISFLERRLGSNFELISQSKNGEIWIISNSIPDEGPYFFVYERKSHHLSLISAPKLDLKKHFSKMYEMIVKARDGENLVCYYTLPKAYDQGGYVSSPIPLIVVSHGGPFKVRDKFEFDPYHQWLASLGYAVLSVNFRLSSGFGKAFVNAGNGQWGGKAHLDVMDAAEECIARGITEKGKLAIFGGSYGGFEALAALTFTPDYFTCCISHCGPSHLKTVLDNVPKFWELPSKPLSDKTMFFTKQAFITSMGGDPDSTEGAKYLEECSPLNHLDAIMAPLLLIHGQNDYIVAEQESRQIYESMKKREKNVTYILFPDEGHGCCKFANKMLYLDQVERFLSKHLHGVYHPSHQKWIATSSAIIF